jgi:hypothetical protein
MIFKSKYTNEYTNMYRYSHMIIGGIFVIKTIPYKYKIGLFCAILIYQFGQLLFNVRCFFNKNKLVSGNSINHTLNKLLDYFLGYVIIWIFLM